MMNADEPTTLVLSVYPLPDAHWLILLGPPDGTRRRAHADAGRVKEIIELTDLLYSDPGGQALSRNDALRCREHTEGILGQRLMGLLSEEQRCKLRIGLNTDRPLRLLIEADDPQVQRVPFELIADAPDARGVGVLTTGTARIARLTADDQQHLTPVCGGQLRLVIYPLDQADKLTKEAVECYQGLAKDHNLDCVLLDESARVASRGADLLIVIAHGRVWSDGRPVVQAATGLASALIIPQLARPWLRSSVATMLVVCEAGAAAVENLAAHLVRAGAPVVIACQTALRFETARLFLMGFLGKLKEQRPVDEAAAEGARRVAELKRPGVAFRPWVMILMVGRVGAVSRRLRGPSWPKELLNKSAEVTGLFQRAIERSTDLKGFIGVEQLMLVMAELEQSPTDSLCRDLMLLAKDHKGAILKWLEGFAHRPAPVEPTASAQDQVQLTPRVQRVLSAMKPNDGMARFWTVLLSEPFCVIGSALRLVKQKNSTYETTSADIGVVPKGRIVNVLFSPTVIEVVGGPDDGLSVEHIARPQSIVRAHSINVDAIDTIRLFLNSTCEDKKCPKVPNKVVWHGGGALGGDAVTPSVTLKQGHVYRISEVTWIGFR